MQCCDGQNCTLDSCRSGDIILGRIMCVYRYTVRLRALRKVPTTSHYVFVYIYMTTAIITIHYWMRTRFNPIWPLRKPPHMHRARTHTRTHACTSTWRAREALWKQLLFGFTYKHIIYIYIYNTDRCVSVSAYYILFFLTLYIVCGKNSFCVKTFSFST